MATKKAYLIRTQGHGIHTDVVFLNPPSKERVQAALDAEVERHGLDPKTGDERKRWARVVEIELDDSKPNNPADPETFHKWEGEPRELEAPQPTQGTADKPPIEFSGQGRVINPGDPDHPGNQ